MFARRIAVGSDAAVGPVEICVTVGMKDEGEGDEKIDIMVRVSFVSREGLQVPFPDWCILGILLLVANG